MASRRVDRCSGPGRSKATALVNGLLHRGRAGREARTLRLVDADVVGIFSAGTATGGSSTPTTPASAYGGPVDLAFDH